MDLKLLEYIVQIANENNITHAAEKLFITQSGLNQQLLKLEKELGTPLFHRSRTNCRPTAAGEVYLKSAREILRMKKEAYSVIYDIADTKKGSLSVGFTPDRGIAMFTKVYPRFHAEYPDMEITPMELSVRRQQELIANGDLDIGFLTIEDGGKSNLRYINICKEDIVLALPKTHRLAKGAGAPLGVLDVKECRDDYFVLMYKESSLRPLIDSIFEAAGFAPKALFDTSSNNAIVTMIESGLSCGIVPYYYVRAHLERVACFFLPERPTWNIVACYRGGIYISNAAKRFIELAAEYWKKTNN